MFFFKKNNNESNKQSISFRVTLLPIANTITFVLSRTSRRMKKKQLIFVVFPLFIFFRFFSKRCLPERLQSFSDQCKLYYIYIIHLLTLFKLKRTNYFIKKNIISIMRPKDADFLYSFQVPMVNALVEDIIRHRYCNIYYFITCFFCSFQNN